MKPLIACLLLLSSFFIRVSTFAADSPQLIPFQGTLVNSAGTAYPNGQYAITFAIYNEAVGGTPVWTERHEKVGVINGMVNVFLGSINSFLKTNWGDNVNFGTTKYLGITVDADGNPATADKEMAPRQLLLTAFYAPTTDKLQDYGWDVLFGNQSPNTSAIQATKIPQLTLDKLPQIPGSKLAANITSDALAAANQSIVPSGGIVMSENANNTALLNAGYTKIGSGQMGEGWTTIPSTPLLSARLFSACAAWGNVFLVWGGEASTGMVGDGARYDSITKTWSPMSAVNAPSPRRTENHGPMSGAVWTGNELIIWGGFNRATGSLGTGARYNPSNDTWTTIPTAGAPLDRINHANVWTGTELIVWGGFRSDGVSTLGRLQTGARYNVATNTWTATSLTGAPSARYAMSFVWTGTEMIIWGGHDGTNFLGDGARYNPSTDTWTPLPPHGGKLSPRMHPMAFWTGSKVIIYGGESGETSPPAASFDPATNTWTSLASSPISGDRTGAVGVWTGESVLVWGGDKPGNGTVYSDGAIYSPVTDTWQSTLSPGTARRLTGHAWSVQSRALFAFGGTENSVMQSNGLLYTPPRTLYLYQKQ
ncbi:MAG: hypothetical protein JNM99_16950 [Verrucomicrobiaceae bacterium]|nr:hypothetical protein [Verrucomicrobiaceae bacterium]